MYTVDASVWVNAFDQREPGYHVSRQFLEVVRDQAVPIIVPNLVLVESRRGDQPDTPGASVGTSVCQRAASAAACNRQSAGRGVCSPRPYPGGPAWAARRRCGLCGGSARSGEHTGHLGQRACDATCYPHNGLHTSRGPGGAATSTSVPCIMPLHRD